MMNTDFSNAPAMYFWGTPNNYAVKPSPECDLSKIPNFSIFRRPITNKRPYQVVNLVDVYNYIISNYARIVPSSTEVSRWISIASNTKPASLITAPFPASFP